MKDKLITFGVSLIVLLTLNLTLFNSYASFPSIPFYQQKITIINSQNVSTPNPFQQEILLNESNYQGFLVYNGSFANFEFTYANNTTIPAWVQSNNSGQLLIWLKLYSIPAFSSITIYLDIFLNGVNLLSSSGNGIGEAPGLSPVYGEYDNGQYIFSIYVNGNTPLSDFSVQSNFELSRSSNGYLNLTGISAWSGNGDIPFIYNKISLPPYYNYIASGYGEWWLSNMTGLTNIYGGLVGANVSGDTDIVSLVQIGGSQQTDAIGVEGIPGEVKGETNTQYVYYAFGIDIFSNGGFIQGIDAQGTANGNWVYGSITYIAGASNFTVHAVSGSQSYFASYSNPILKSGVDLYLGVIGSETAPPATPLVGYSAHAYYAYLYVRCISSNDVMPLIKFGSSLVDMENSNQNLVFNSQSFSFMISPMFIVYLVIFIFLIFSVYIAIDVVRRRK